MVIAVGGALGHMGKAVTKLAEEKELEVLGVDIRADSSMQEHQIYSSFSQLPGKMDALIDFSSPDALSGILSYAKCFHVPCVLCTTGYSEEDIHAIEAASGVIPVFRSANMSLGISVVSHLVQEAVRMLGSSFDIEIVETHHRRKKDAPSGTALMLRDAVCEAGGGTNGTVLGRQGNHSARQPGEIGIHAVRGGTVTGTHDIRFLGEMEQVSISHIAEDRTVFASGAVQAALFLKNKGAGLYNMDDLLSERLGY